MNASVSNKTFFAFQGLISALKSLKQKKNRDCPLSRNKHCEDFHEQFLKIENDNKGDNERLVRKKKASYPKSTRMV